MRGPIGFPELRDSGIENSKHYIAMPVLGKSLHDIISFNGNTFTIKTSI